MCDPLTLALGALGAIGAKSKTPTPPAAVIPAAPVEDAKEATGAEIILGGERDLDILGTKKKTTTTTSKTTEGTGLRTGKSTGLNIL